MKYYKIFIFLLSMLILFSGCKRIENRRRTKAFFQRLSPEQKKDLERYKNPDLWKK